jgi:hypothetical protein
MKQSIIKFSNILILHFSFFIFHSPGLRAQSIEWGTGVNTYANDINVGSSERSYIEFYYQVKNAAITNMQLEVVLPYSYETFDISAIQRVEGIDLGSPVLANATSLRFRVADVVQNSIIHYRIPRYSNTQPNTVYANPSYNVTVRVGKNNSVSGGNLLGTNTLPFKYNYAKLDLVDPELPLPAKQISPLGLRFYDNYEAHPTGYTGPETFLFRIQCVDGKVDSANISFTVRLGGVQLGNWVVGATPIPDHQIQIDTLSGTSPLVRYAVKIRKTDFPSGNGISNGEYVPVGVTVIKASCGNVAVDYLTSWGLTTNIKNISDVNTPSGITFTADSGNGLSPRLERVAGSETWTFAEGKACYDGSYNNTFSAAYANTGQGEAGNIRLLVGTDSNTLLDTSSVEVKTSSASPWEKALKVIVFMRISASNSQYYNKQARYAYVDLSQTLPAGDTLYVRYNYAMPADYFLYQQAEQGIYSSSRAHQRIGITTYTDACGENPKSISNEDFTLLGSSSSSISAYGNGLYNYDTNLNFDEPDQVQTWQSTLYINSLRNTALYTNTFKIACQVSLPTGMALAYDDKDSIKIYRSGYPPGTSKWPVGTLQTNAAKDTFIIELYRADMTNTGVSAFTLEIPFRNVCTTGAKAGSNKGEIRMFIYPTGSEGAGCNEVKFDGLQIRPTFNYVCEKEGITYMFDYKRMTRGWKDDDEDGHPDLPFVRAHPDSIQHLYAFTGDTLRFAWKGKTLSAGDTALYAVLLSSLAANMLEIDGSPKESTLNGNSGQLRVTLLNDVYASGNYTGFATPRDRGTASNLTDPRYAYAWEIGKTDNTPFAADDSVGFIIDALRYRDYSGASSGVLNISNWFYAAKTSRIKGLTTATANTKVDSVLIPGETRKGKENYPVTISTRRPYLTSGTPSDMLFSGIQTTNLNNYEIMSLYNMPTGNSLTDEYRHFTTVDSLVIDVPEGYELPDPITFRMAYYKPSSTNVQYTPERAVYASPSNLPHHKAYVFGSAVFDVHRNDPGKWPLPSGSQSIYARPFSISSTYAAPVGESYGSLTIYCDDSTHTTIPNSIPRMGKESAGVDYTYKNATRFKLLYTDPGSVKALAGGPTAQDALSSNISWEVNLQNTAVDTAAYNAWLYVQGPISNAKFQAGANTCTGTGDEGRWIPLPTLPKAGVAIAGTLTVEYASSDCSNQPVTVYPLHNRTKGNGTTWQPSDEGIAMTDAGFASAQTDDAQKQFIYAKLNLAIRNVASRLSGNITPLATTPASPLHTSGASYGASTIAVDKQFPVEIAISTFGAAGSSVDTRMRMTVPAGLEALVDSAYIEINGTNHKITTANGNAFLTELAKLNGTAGAKNIELKLADIDLPALNGTLGEVLGNDTVRLRLKLIPRCDVDLSSPRIALSLFGKRLCGDTIASNNQLYYSSFLPLGGITSSLSPDMEVVAPAIATTDFICKQSDTLSVKFRVINNVAINIAATDSLFVIVPHSLTLKDATSIRYSLPAGSAGSPVTAQSGIVPPTSIAIQETTIGGNHVNIITWPIPKDYFDALKGTGATGTAQANYNEYKLCLQMNDPEDYFNDSIQAGIITGASIGASCGTVSTRENMKKHAFTARGIHTTWLGNAATDNKNWFNAGNWSDGVPGKCTNVTIAAQAGNFPTLSDTLRIDSIHFNAGMEIGGVPYLNYRKASVDLKTQSNQWHLVSAPLMGMYSGDYILSGNRTNPPVYMRKYQSRDYWTGEQKKVAQWTTSFGTTNVPLSPGTGYAVWVDKDPTQDLIFNFPKDSMSYAVYNQAGTAILWKEQIPAGGRDNSYRFAFDDKFSQSAGKNSREFDLPVENGADATYTNLLLANPFMSHLDFQAFRSHTANSSKIQNLFYVWNGNSFTAIDQAVSESSGGQDARYIAPQQSVVVLRNGIADVSTLHFTPAMSVANVGAGLRSATLNRPSRLKLKIYKYDKLQSEAEIRYKQGASNGFDENEDAWTLFSENVKKAAIIYSKIENSAASINTLGNINEHIPLGIKTTEASELKFEIEGAETFDGEVYLVDAAVQGTEINLKETPEYTFQNTTGDIPDRFYIRVKGATTGINNTAAGRGILICREHGKIVITGDANDPLLSIEISNAQGQVIVKQAPASSSVSIPVPAGNRVIVVKAVSEKTQQVKKLLIH